MRCYLAGGAVRDLLLGGFPREFDIVFDGSPDDLQRQYPYGVAKVGKQTPVYLVHGVDHMPLRGASVTDDLMARDFTMNALLLEENGVLHMLPQTVHDLKNGIIRQVSPSALADDPLRVFRAARFCALRPDFSIEEHTLQAMRDTAEKGLLAGIAGERVGREFLASCAGSHPDFFFRTLAHTGCLAHWFPEMEAARHVPAGPAAYHGENSVFEHGMHVMAVVAASGLPEKDHILGVWMALCHDFGKILTQKERLPRHIGHDARGLELVSALVQRLRLPSRFKKAGMLALTAHMRAGIYAILRPGTKVDLLHTLTTSGMALPFCAMVAADSRNCALRDTILSDIDLIRSVRLPEVFRNKGESSASTLRKLRIDALVASQNR